MKVIRVSSNCLALLAAFSVGSATGRSTRDTSDESGSFAVPTSEQIDFIQG